ncbi:MAG: ABC transporter permease [Actinomycetota bacterium]|nr:ABC transporter permease [Actinomycetota bacterium]
MSDNVTGGAVASPMRKLSVAETQVVPLVRLTRVELRKLVDTRAGRWLLIAIGVITAAVVVIFLFAAPAEELTYAQFLNATIIPQAVLLPILGILTVTSEWGQRTGLVTFTLEPHRGRIVMAKLLAVLVMGIAVVCVAFVLAAVGNALGAALQDGNGSWEFGVSGVIDTFAFQLISVVQGLALGMLIMNTAGAIVTYFAIPFAWGFLTATVSWFATIGAWVDLNTTTIPLSTHEMTGESWAKLGVSVFIWVLVPLVLGWMRLLRRELKSA